MPPWSLEGNHPLDHHCEAVEDQKSNMKLLPVLCQYSHSNVSGKESPVDLSEKAVSVGHDFEAIGQNEQSQSDSGSMLFDPPSGL